MKTHTICLNLFGNPKCVQAISAHWKDDFETKQVATYTVEGGIATITKLSPVLGTVVNIPLPLIVPVNDLGSGRLTRVELNCNTMRPLLATCPTKAWAERQTQATPLTIPQQLKADYCALL